MNTQLFNFNNQTLSVIIDNDNNPLFIAKDVTSILGYRTANDAIKYLDEDERGTIISRTLGGEQNVSYITESGLYSLILRSNKPEAKVFKKWVTAEVLPSIRKHGAYMTPQKIEEVLLNPDLIIQLATNLKIEQEKTRLQQQQIEEQKPLVNFATSLLASSDSILIGEFAKILTQNGYRIGQNRLFEYLRVYGYLLTSGERKNLPSSTSIERGLFEVKTSTITSEQGTRINKTAKITVKGQEYFINKFLKK